MADPKIAGVGAFGDLGTHKLDILTWMMGDIEAVSALLQNKQAIGFAGRRNDAQRLSEPEFWKRIGEGIAELRRRRRKGQCCVGDARAKRRTLREDDTGEDQRRRQRANP